MLQTERLILRNWQHSDLEPFAKLNADPEVMKYFPTTLSPKESNELVKRLEAHHQLHGFGFWAVEERLTSTFIGFIGLNVPSFNAHFMPVVEVGWRLSKAYWGKGYATEGAKKALKYGFKVLDLSEIVSFTAKSNWRSIAVMKRLGMVHRAADNFKHPRLPLGHPLQWHVLYRINQKSFWSVLSR